MVRVNHVAPEIDTGNTDAYDVTKLIKCSVMNKSKETR
jgi:hypothetical protein